MELHDTSCTRKVKTGTGRLLAEISYGPVAEVHGRQVAVTGAPPGALVDDWPVVFVDDMRVLDSDGRTRLHHGEGLLLGLVAGMPRWRIDGDDLSDAFERAVAERRAICIDDPGHVRAREATCTSKHPPQGRSE